ncbi:M14 family zinc carboxypeptidase [Halalkalibacter okhensis]|uniref:Peptidase M14 domain-containing protein n=1 Tax=Halalkalibacter okhensis TaxID=333138 RepID=A0A0B0IF00_9BACI|nr:M14 family zinc carboxypeptidase [Halalkalibacter okhensis]KHF39432.1 hypothetical protein LQ50_15340 [Halalkalibacter okhensis]
MVNFQTIIDNVPDYNAFLTVNELDKSSFKLAKEFPHAVSIHEVGRSRKGHPIQCLKIGDGSKNALCFAFPHPNEPIGAMTMEYFSFELAKNKELRDELDFTWYIIKCIDPDGARLNENWFKGPFTIHNYTKNFFRPVGYEQVEWTFPIDYKELHFNSPLPETKALMKMMEDIKPDFVYSLHNAGFGGAYWYISQDIPELYEGLLQSAVKQKVALSLGEPEAPFVTQFAPAVFQTMGLAQVYDYTETFTGKVPQMDTGTSSADYASRQSEDCVTLLTELPYFFDKRIEDMSEGDMTRKEAINKNIEMNEAHFSIIDGFLKEVRPYITKENPFVKLVDQIMLHEEESNTAKKNWANSDPAFDQKAKVSNIFDNLLTAKFYNGLALGLTVRTIEYELERLKNEDSKNPEGISLLEDQHDKSAALLKSFCEELERELDYSVIPIQKLVRIQLESGLLVAEYIHKKKS